MAEYVDKDAAMDEETLLCWCISSIDETVPPVWTAEHIEELLNDFLVIPKETPVADVRPEKHGEWISKVSDFGDKIFQCSNCYMRILPSERVNADYCKYCGAKMDKSSVNERG